MRDVRPSLAIAAISVGVLFMAACVDNGSIRDAPGATKNPLDATRKLLQSLRPEVEELLGSLPSDAEVDGMPLLRKEAKLFYWAPGEEFPAEGVTWVLDAWGRPLVLVDSEDDPEDWCLISAGSDGLWTSDGVIGGKREADKQIFAEHAPHYYGAEDSVHRRVLGDDVVVHSTGLYFKPYEYPVPKVKDVVKVLLQLLTDAPRDGNLSASPDLVDELGDSTKEEKDLAAIFIKTHEAGFFYCEDSWSHDCSRKDGFLPYLFLCHPGLFEGTQPPFWIQPQDDGWAIDWNFDDLLEAADPGRKKDEGGEQQVDVLPASGSFEFLGKSIETRAAVFVLELTAEIERSDAWVKVKDAAIRAITDFPENGQFGIIVFGADVQKFPASGAPADATSASKLAAIRFLQSAASSELTAGSLEKALSAALQLVNQAAGAPREVLLAGTGQTACPDQESESCERRLVASISAQNRQRVAIHAFGLGVESERTQNALKTLCAENGGSYIQLGN